MGLNDRRGAANAEPGTYRAKNTELFNREIKADKNTSEKIYSRDTDNLYPLRIEKVINNSPTGRRCANLMAKYITGKGNINNFPVGKGIFINDILRKAGRSIAYQYGVYFRLKYVLDAEKSQADGTPAFKVGSVEVLDYVVMAKSKEDDADYPGKLYAIEDDNEGGLSKSDEDMKWFYPYNRDNKVIKAQMINDCKEKEIDNPTFEQLLHNYRGQVYYMNLTPEYVYALPLADSVYNDLDTEFRISNYNNTQTRKGFLGKTVIVKYEEDEESEEEFDKEVAEFLGSENSSSVFTVAVPQNVDKDLDKAFVVQQLKPQFDDKLFESTIKNLRQNIMGAFNNIPEALVFSGDGAMFGTSSDTYTEMKKFYWEQNEDERSALEQTLRLFGYYVNILPLVDEAIEDDGDTAIKKKSQAELRGSVGGVTAILAIQKSVSEGSTDITAAVAIIEEIYGISKELAEIMVGTPKVIENTGTDGE